MREKKIAPPRLCMISIALFALCINLDDFFFFLLGHSYVKFDKTNG